jgi:hypothetical protein
MAIAYTTNAVAGMEFRAAYVISHELGHVYADHLGFLMGGPEEWVNLAVAVGWENAARTSGNPLAIQRMWH